MTDRAPDTRKQQPCVHCGECARACPEALDPEALFFALVADDLAREHGQALDACSECNRCTEACPSHIPLLDWFRWGKSEQRERARADVARERYLARNARLARDPGVRTAARGRATPAPPAERTISRAEVLAAIARGRATARASVPDRRTAEPPASRGDKGP